MPPMENSISEAPEQKEDHQQEEGFDSLQGEVRPSGMEESVWSNLSRKEKRKALKKMKRRNTRKEIAIKEREEEETRLNDPEEQRRIELLEKEEEVRRERARKEFDEREKAWIEAMEMKRKKQQEVEEERRKALEDLEKKRQVENENGKEEDDGEWEYIEEGPAEIIWKGNEIIVKKKKVRVPKKDSDQQSLKQDVERPTSNPLPPQSEAFAEYKNASAASAQELLENVAQQVPNFGTEQDKAHCPFHLKTGACRFGQRCSRVHFYPDKSCTILIKNMYNGPGLAWEQDEGLEYSDEEVERSYEEFYEDVHTEFLKFGELVNFKVCRNGSFHLRGNVYVHYKSLESAMLAYHSINGRYFAGKQVQCEFVNVTRWKVAICGEYMKSRYKTCSHGTACNFIHCFCNPGGDYEWADWDKQPPRFWVNKMAALFGYSEEYEHEKQMLPENLGQPRNLGRTTDLDSKRWHSRRSSSRETSRRYDNENDFHVTYDNNEQRDCYDESRHEKRNGKYHHHVHRKTSDDLRKHRLSRERSRERDHNHARERRKHRNVSEARKDLKDVKKRSDESDPYEDCSDDGMETCHGHFRRSSKKRRIEHDMDIRKRSDELNIDEDLSDDAKETHNGYSRSSKHRKVGHAYNMDIKERSSESDPYEDFSDVIKETHDGRSRRSLKCRKVDHVYNMDMDDSSCSHNGRIRSQQTTGSNSSYLNQIIDIDDRWKPEDKDSVSCWDVET